MVDAESPFADVGSETHPEIEIDFHLPPNSNPFGEIDNP
jgi:hypothetical protein